MSRSGWDEAQIRDTIEAYFGLLEAQERNEVVNKSALYKALSAKHPERSAKAFELKFQNISAVLYEESMPYCDGLKPRFNYQNLMRLLVLDRLKKAPLKEQEPHTILFRKLRELKKRGYLPVNGRGTGRFGLAVEEALGIPQNSDKAPDFMGIELKTKTDKSLQTLFSRVPSAYIDVDDKKGLVADYGYQDEKKGRRALYTSFNNTPDRFGFKLFGEADHIVILNGTTRILEYNAESIEAALLSKHSQTAYIGLSKRKGNGKEECKVESVFYCKFPSIIRFMRLVNAGQVFLDFTLSESNGKVRDHGFLWRIRGEALADLYLHSESQ